MIPEEVRLPEMVCALSLPEAAARHHTDSRFLEEPQTVQHVRLHSQSLRMPIRVKSVNQSASEKALHFTGFMHHKMHVFFNMLVYTITHHDTPFVLGIELTKYDTNAKVQATI